MIAFIVSPETELKLNKGLEGLKVCYEKVGILTKEETELCIRRIRMLDEVDLLILDYAAFQDHEENLIMAVKNYRMVREEERIIVIIKKNLELAEALSKYDVFDFVVID